MIEKENLSRRDFLKASAAVTGGLVVAFYLPDAQAKVAEKLLNAKGEEQFAPNAFLTIRPDNTVTVFVKHLEMGQGVYTGLPTLIAEELDVPWEHIRAEGAPADAAHYGNIAFGGMQGTGGSTAMFSSWQSMREAGAAARLMLLQAAAAELNVPIAELHTEAGEVVHAKSGAKKKYGELVGAAAKLPVPRDVKLKDPKDYKIIGTHIARKDGAGKVNGQAIFALDVREKNQLTALILRPPLFGATVASFNAKKALAMHGVHEVFKVPSGIAIIADTYWVAKNARAAIEVKWNEEKAFKKSSDELLAEYKELLKKEGAVAANKGNVTDGEKASAKTVEAVYEFPYLAHSPMEVLNCVIQVKNGGCTIWSGDQMQTVDQAAVAKILGLPPQKVEINTLLAGGSFGRRATPTADLVSEAAYVVKGSKLHGRPIHLMWSREDDVQGGYYRPMVVHSVKAGLDSHNKIAVWNQRTVTQSIMAGTPFAGMMKDGIDPTSVEGNSDLAYDVANLRVELHSPAFQVPVLWWRSVGHTHTAFVAETMIDELAHQAGEDPLEFRLRHLSQHPRRKEVLKLVAEKSGWGKSKEKNVGYGIAVHESFRTFVAEVAKVRILEDGNSFKVEKLWCAVDCGVAVNPDNIKAQMEGGMGFSLSAALHSAIAFDKGQVQQSNFHNYQVMRMNEMPQVEVHIVKSTEAPTGVGEPGVPCVAPAVANAIFAATGKRLRKLPLTLA